MSIMDTRAKFATAEAASGTVAVRLEGDVYDLGENHRDIGDGQPVYVTITITTAFDSAGSATVNFKVVSDAQAALAVDGSATEHAQTGAMDYDELTLGKTFNLMLPLEGRVYERYLGIIVDTAGATTTAGAFSAWMSPDPAGNTWKAYPEAAS